MKLLSVITTSLALLIGCTQASTNPLPVTGNTTVHDPTMCKDGSGKYWLFATGTGLTIRTSPDRVQWDYVGTVWPNGANWTDPFTGAHGGFGDLWAPDCTIVDGTFYLYYAASSFGSQTSAIFLATSKTGLPGSWTNEGIVVSTTPANDFNAIDPNLLIDGNKWYLSLGSFWTGIKLFELEPKTGKTLRASPIASLAKRTANSGALEASIVFKYGQYYYNFNSWDNCCMGANSTYNVRIGRSKSVTGPYVDQEGTPLLQGGGSRVLLGSHDFVIGPGGQDILMDVDGPIILYHYYTTKGSFIGMNKLSFTDGWPEIA